MTITLIDHPTQLHPTAPLEAPRLESAPAGEPLDCVDYDPDPVVVAVQRQAAASCAATRETGSPVLGSTNPVAEPYDTQRWLFAERARYLREGTCDPYAQLMLMRAGLLTPR